MDEHACRRGCLNSQLGMGTHVHTPMSESVSSETAPTDVHEIYFLMSLSNVRCDGPWVMKHELAHS